MIEIRPLKPVTYDVIEAFGFNGFTTNKVIELRENKINESIVFNLEYIQLKNVYKKEWTLSHDAIVSMNETISEDLSFGAYDQDVLVGFVLTTAIKWNNSLWIENIRIADDYKGLGIAKSLLEHIKTVAKEKDFRVIGLEVMGSNVPAIELYKKRGYLIDGFDRSHYPTRHGSQKELAIFMKLYIADLI